MGASLERPRHPISVDEFHRMGNAGILAPDDRVELFEGELVRMAPIGSWHAGKVIRAARLLTRCIGDHALVSVQNPILLSPNTELLPDIAILRAREDCYEESLPSAADILVVVEISDTSTTYDRDVKIPLYARHGIAEAWLIDRSTRTLSIFLDPSETGYGRVLTPAIDACVTLAHLPDVSIPLDLW